MSPQRRICKIIWKIWWDDIFFVLLHCNTFRSQNLISINIILMRHIVLLSLLLFMSATLCGCREESVERDPLAQRTVIVYMSAENNLSSFSRDDLRELTDGSKGLNGRQRLVAFVDDASVSTPAIIELKGGKRDTLKLFEHDFYASAPDKFREIIQFIENECPARSYGLVLWGHAKGWIIENDSIESATSRPRKAFGVDNGSNLEVGFSFGNRWMNITQMAHALDGLPRFRFIFADCCCMMCVETAYELRHVTDYLLGSPAEIPGNGAPYHKIAPLFFSESDDFYKAIIDTYYDDYMGRVDYPGCSVPLSVVDMSHIEELAQATRTVLRAPSEYDTEKIAYYFQYKNDVPVMYDMCSLMERNLAENDYHAWKRVLDMAVPYRRFSEKWMTDTTNFDIYKGFGVSIFNQDNYGGLSMFVEKPEYNFSRHDFNRDICKTSWYWAVGWNRFQ